MSDDDIFQKIIDLPKFVPKFCYGIKCFPIKIAWDSKMSALFTRTKQKSKQPVLVLYFHTTVPVFCFTFEHKYYKTWIALVKIFSPHLRGR